MRFKPFCRVFECLLLILSFLNRFGAFMRVLEVYFVVTSKCDQDRTERSVADATIVAAEIEHACTRTITVTAPAIEERTARVRKDRVIAVPRCATATARARFINRISIFT